MNNPNHLIKILAAGCCIAMTVCLANAAEPSVPIPEGEVSVEKVKTFFDAAFMKTQIDKDGDLQIEDSGFKTFVRVDKKKKLISIFSLWTVKASVAEAKKLKAVNTLNDSLIVVRFAISDPTTLTCDYQVPYEGGITAYAMVNNYRLFARVVKEAADREEMRSILGED